MYMNYLDSSYTRTPSLKKKRRMEEAGIEASIRVLCDYMLNELLGYCPKREDSLEWQNDKSCGHGRKIGHGEVAVTLTKVRCSMLTQPESALGRLVWQPSSTGRRSQGLAPHAAPAGKGQRPPNSYSLRTVPGGEGFTGGFWTGGSQATIVYRRGCKKTVSLVAQPWCSAAV